MGINKSSSQQYGRLSPIGAPERMKKVVFAKEMNIVRKLVVLLLLFIFTISVILVLPSSNKKSFVFKVEKGQNVSQIAQNLQDKNLVSSEVLIRLLFAVSGASEKIKAGEYIFQPRASMVEIVRALKTGDYGKAYVWVTIPEGSSVREIARIVNKKIPAISQGVFVNKAKSFEGYLFPETYHFSKNASADEVIGEMTKTFNDKTRALQVQFGSSEFKKAIIVASMLEKEAVSYEDAKVIAGIIQNRLRTGMRLQIDATLKYFTGRGSAQLTRSDLASKNSYNTYRHEGLPPGPISNPGFEMISAALYPESSNYLYYLHAPNKKAYYSVTHEQHVKYKNQYLK